VGDSVGLVEVVAVVPDDNAAIAEMVDVAGLAAVNADEREAAEDTLGPEPIGEAVFDAQAVHQGEDFGLGPDAGPDELLGIVEGSGLEGADDQVDAANVPGGAVGVDLYVEIAVTALDGQAIGADGVVVPAHEEMQVVSSLLESASVEASDCSAADDRDSHGVSG